MNIRLVWFLFTVMGLSPVCLGQSNAHIVTVGRTDTDPPLYIADGADLSTILGIYASLTDRTLLVHPDVRSQNLFVSIKSGEKAAFVGAVEEFLRTNHIVALSDGEKFKVIIPADFEKKFHDAASSLPAPVVESTGKGKYEMNYDSVAMEQALPVYADLIHRKLADGFAPSGEVTFKTNGGLTKAEMIHAFDVLFIFAGAKPVYVGDDSFKFERL